MVEPRMGVGPNYEVTVNIRWRDWPMGDADVDEFHRNVIRMVEERLRMRDDRGRYLIPQSARVRIRGPKPNKELIWERKEQRQAEWPEGHEGERPNQYGV